MAGGGSGKGNLNASRVPPRPGQRPEARDFGYISALFWHHFDTNLDHLGSMLDAFWEYFDFILELFWHHVAPLGGRGGVF